MDNSSGRLGSFFFKQTLVALACATAILCQSASPRAATAAANPVRSVDVEHSWMRVHVGKEGLFAFAGDEHQVNVPIASGSLDEERKSVELTIDAEKMRVLDPPSRRDKVQANMLGPQVLDVKKYPTISFRSTSVIVSAQAEESAPKLWIFKGDLTLHGQTHSISVTTERFDANHFTGSARFKQSEFGITPIRVAAGAVRVKDYVDITFDIALR
jgi:polyisoprenoid-binding protein YceI